MKKILVLVLIISNTNAYGQTWEEWFQQKETQKKYLLEQIAALEVYIDYAAKGYEIVTKGLQVIDAVKRGDFNLHQLFFNSLKQVNPAVAYKVTEIHILAYKLNTALKQLLVYVSELKELTAEEKTSAKYFLQNLQTASQRNLDDLVAVTTSGVLEMHDDERLKRIELIYQDMQSIYTILQTFSTEIKMLSAQRLREKREVEVSKRIRGN